MNTSNVYQKHLTLDKRFKIEKGIDEKKSFTQIANDICKTLQYKLNLTDDELISLEINELKKQLIKVRTEISKQLCLKVWDLTPYILLKIATIFERVPYNTLEKRIKHLF